MRVLVTGSRYWTDSKVIEDLLDHHNPDEVIHGGARGADSIAHAWCKKRGRIAHVHFPDYEREGKGAPLKRNDVMAGLMPDLVLAFPIESSRGTWFTVSRAKSRNLWVIVTKGAK